MKNKKNSIFSIVLIVLMSAGAVAIVLPTAMAHTPAWNEPTYAFVTCSPSTVGVNQYTQIVMWLDKFPPTAGGLGGDRWRGFSLTITKPDGTTQTLGPFTSGPVGSTYTTYNPDQAGTYKVVLNFPGQTLTNGTGVPNTQGTAFVGDYFQPSTSDPFYLTVQQSAIAQWVEPSLPTGYWTLPINDANRAWSGLASNWPGGSWFQYSSFQDEGQAPNSAHILWQQPIIPGYPGGILDARYPGIPSDVNDYESPWSTPIVMDGKIYYNAPQTAESDKYGYYSINLYTGQQLWYKNGTDNGLNNNVVNQIYSGLGGAGVYSGQSFPLLSFGQIMNYYGVNGAGTLPYLWITQGTTWNMIDAGTGNWIMSLVNVPGGTAAVDQDGALLRISYNSATGRILMWNSSQAIPPASPIGTGQQQWKPSVGVIIDAVNDTRWTQWGIYQDFNAADIAPRSGYTMNVTVQAHLPALANVIDDANHVPKLLFFWSLIGQSGLPGGTDNQTFEVAVVRLDQHVAPYSPYPSETPTQNNNLGYGATLLFDKFQTYPISGNKTWGFGPIDYEDGVFTLMCKETRQWFGYSLSTGAQLWGPSTQQSSWDMYQVSYTGTAGGNYAYGKLFSYSYGGILYAFDMTTGKLSWTYNATQIGYESPYGNYPLSIGAIADGKIYLYSTEHSPTKPLWRGSYVRCINATDGKELWKLLDFNMGLAVADGYIVSGNQYDNNVYCIGKGPSAVTVTASPKIQSVGSAILVEGTVTDQSPGAKGTPAISDANQEVWMEYLYEQQAKPSNVTGVPVMLTAMDPNGNIENIGTATSDMSGAYNIMWTPPVPGKYVITASFAGTNSYGPSSAETAIGMQSAPAASVSVSPAVSPTLPPGSTPISPSQTPLTSPSSSVIPPGSGTAITTYIAIGAAVIIIVAIAAALVLRRRK